MIDFPKNNIRAYSRLSPELLFNSRGIAQSQLLPEDGIISFQSIFSLTFVLKVVLVILIYLNESSLLNSTFSCV
jgi:hypothetical protein